MKYYTLSPVCLHYDSPKEDAMTHDMWWKTHLRLVWKKCCYFSSITIRFISKVVPLTLFKMLNSASVGEVVSKFNAI